MSRRVCLAFYRIIFVQCFTVPLTASSSLPVQPYHSNDVQFMTKQKVRSSIIGEFFWLFFSRHSYDGYLREAHRTYKETCKSCAAYNWPKLIGNNLDPPERCKPIPTYHEGEEQK